MLHATCHMAHATYSSSPLPFAKLFLAFRQIAVIYWFYLRLSLLTTLLTFLPSLLEEILATPRGSVSPSLHPSNSLPVMPSHIQPPPAIEPPRIRPHVVIIEEPTNRTIRFRYQCENRTAASIPGMNSTPENRTFPTIQIVGYEGSVLVIISCVTSKPPYHQHPHVLISREDEDNCRHGVYSKKLKPGERRLELQKVGIQCVRRRDVKTSLLARQARNIDPFNGEQNDRNM